MTTLRCLPCRNCHEAASLPSRANPQGIPVLAQRPVNFYRCGKCRVAYDLSPAAFRELPVLSKEDLEDLFSRYPGSLEHYSRDFLGIGLSEAQTLDVLGAGLGGVPDLGPPQD